ncbi:MAG: response regulator transcription factor [Kiritimatiellae bacterium]|nr:response regulator transcription factor [Kiritimatiellia bacterium]
MKPLKILIVDDHAIVRMGLASILETDPEFSVVGEADGGRDALQKAEELEPDIVLMDLMMPDMDGAAATAALHTRFPKLKILILTTFGTADGIAHAIKAGAAGAVMKNIDFKELVAAIRSAAAGKRVLSSEIRRSLEETPPIPELTDRQQQILDSLTRGLTDADIAAELKLSPNGVRDHITAIYTKLGAANRAEAVAIALRKHLLKT